MAPTEQFIQTNRSTTRLSTWQDALQTGRRWGRELLTGFSLVTLLATAQATAPKTLEPAADETLDDIELFDLTLPEIVIAAGRREQLASELPYAVTVVTAEDIRRAGALTIADAMRLVPGSNVAQVSANNPAISVRGMQGFMGRELLILVDGRQIFDAFFGGTMWGVWPFQLEDIERIEVIRGPAGLTWGPNAINGVINIITKSAAKEPTLVLRASAGTQGWNRDYLGYSSSDDRLSFRISSEYERSDGHVRGGTEVLPLDDDFQKATLNLNGTYELSETDELRFAAGSAVLDGGFSKVQLLGPPSTGRGQANYVQLDWMREVERDNHITISSYINDFHFHMGMEIGDIRYQQAALQFTHTFNPAEQHTLTWGIDTRLEYFAAGNEPPVVSRPYITSGIVGLYLQDEWQFAEQWTLSAGARIDYHTHAGFEPSARIGLTHQLSADHFLFGAVLRAVQMTPAPFNYLNAPLLGGLTHWRADGILHNEPVMMYELGYRGHYFDHKLDLSTSLFWSEIQDVLSFELAFPTPVSKTNASLRLYGGEVEVEYRPADDWRLLGYYTYQQFDWHSTFNPGIDREMMTAPRHQFMVGVQHDLTDDLHVSAHWYFVDEIMAPSTHTIILPTKISAYHRLDLTAEYEFWEDRAALTFGVKNLLDNHHPEGGSFLLNDSEVPRLLFAELHLSLP